MRKPLLLAMLLVLAGCAAPAPPAATNGVLPELSDLSPPEVDATRARLWWEDFVMNTPARHTGTPANADAAQRLAEGLEEAGYEVREFWFIPPSARGIGLPIGGTSPVDQGIRTIIGVKEGATMPKNVVGWVAHYDSNAQTVYAAYDDGSGTAVAMELARVLASFENQKTLMAIFFDGEEIGLVGSEAFVQQAMGSKEYVFDLVIGHDMTGINCPGHEWPMYQMVGEDFADRLVPIEEALYRDVMRLDYALADISTPTADLPKACVVILNGHDRNSDERHFKEQGIPILRMAGGRKAVEYPAYHQVNDTVEFVYQFAGGPANYEAGLNLTVAASWWNVATFDRLPPWK